MEQQQAPSRTRNRDKTSTGLSFRAPRLTARQKLTWYAHVFKACVRQHHRSLEPLLSRLIPADGVILDVGGHAGQFAKLFSGLVPDGHVFTIEPGQYALSILRLALRANRLRNVTILPVGVSSESGTMSLSTPIKQSGSLGYGLASLGTDTNRPSYSHEVEITTLDDIVRQLSIEKVNFIKIDIEGWELHAMIGARETLEKFQPPILLEANDEHLSRADHSAGDLFDFLNQFGYDPYSINPDGHSISSVSKPGDGDFLFLVDAKNYGL